METTSRSAVTLDLYVPAVRNIVTRFIRDEVTHAGFTKVVLGLSGGVDSALVAMIAAEALGAANVLGIKMPYRSSSAASLSDADAVATAAGISTETLEITPMVEPYFAQHPDMNNLRRGNVMARQRMIVLFDYSARERALVLGTSNKTELLLGYGTQFGDLASALNPIGDLYKTQIWQLSKEMGVPRQVIDKQPTADLWEGQTDEQELGFTYARVDLLLHHLIDERLTDPELEALGFETVFIQKVRKLVQLNQYKRRPPLIAKISHRTINVDFRYPRDWGI